MSVCTLFFLSQVLLQIMCHCFSFYLKFTAMNAEDKFHLDADFRQNISDMLEEIDRMKSYLHQSSWDLILSKLEQMEKELEILMTLFQESKGK